MPESLNLDDLELPADAAVADDNANPRRRGRRNDEQPPIWSLVWPEERDSFASLVLHPGVKQRILDGLRAVRNRDELERVWSISRIQPIRGRCILNFYGPPGTGKTKAALAVAHKLGRPLLQVDYAGIVSKYLGDTAKHIKAVFEQAAELGAVLFFDEADSLLSKRVSLDQSCATSINQNRNALMQELDRFPGVVVMTTNLFENYDEALLRRIQQHVKFRLPNEQMRRDLIAYHLPAPERVRADYGAIAKASAGMSGGDLLTVCVNAIYAGSRDPDPAKWMVTEAILLREIARVRRSKERHTGKSNRRPIGLGQ